MTTDTPADDNVVSVPRFDGKESTDLGDKSVADLMSAVGDGA